MKGMISVIGQTTEAKNEIYMKGRGQKYNFVCMNHGEYEEVWHNVRSGLSLTDSSVSIVLITERPDLSRHTRVYKPRHVDKIAAN